MDKIIEKAVSKIYDQIAETGVVSENQLYFLMYCDKKQKKDGTEVIKVYGKEILDLVDKIFPTIKWEEEDLNEL